jgi:hypothetical protein
VPPKENKETKQALLLSGCCGKTGDKANAYPLFTVVTVGNVQAHHRTPCRGFAHPPAACGCDKEKYLNSDTGKKSLDSIKRTTKKSIIMSGESTTNNEWIYPGYGAEEELPSYSDVGTPSTFDNHQHNHHNSSTMFDSEDDRRMLVTGMLLAIMVILSMLLCYLVVPLFYDYLRDKIPVSEARKERRYQTIEGWLVSKVRQHDQARYDWFVGLPSDHCCRLLVPYWC